MQSRARMQLLDTIDAIVNGVGRKDAVDLTRDYTRYQVRLGTIVGTEEYEFILLVVQYCTHLYVQTVHVLVRSCFMSSVPAYARFAITNFRVPYRDRVAPP